MIGQVDAAFHRTVDGQGFRCFDFALDKNGTSQMRARLARITGLARSAVRERRRLNLLLSRILLIPHARYLAHRSRLGASDSLGLDAQPVLFRSSRPEDRDRA